MLLIIMHLQAYFYLHAYAYEQHFENAPNSTTMLIAANSGFF